MSLLDSQSEISQTDLLTLLIAVTRAYGIQEAADRGSKVIVDQYDLEAARKLLERRNCKIYKIEPDAITIFDKDDRVRQSINRYVIEVIG